MKAESAAWTGGQYSLVRCVLGVSYAALFVCAQYADTSGYHVRTGIRYEWLVGLSLTLPLIVGYHDRLASLALGAWLLLTAFFLRGSGTELLSLTSLPLFLHAATPPAPYGSLDAAGRTDPRGTWKKNANLQAAAWVLLFACSCGLAWISTVDDWGSRNHALWAGAAMYPLAPIRRLRPWIWLAVLLATTVAIWPIGPFALAPFLLAFSPAWIPPKAMEGAIVFYDGECGLCHRSVRFVLAEDRLSQFRFAPLQGEMCKRAISSDTLATLGDTLVVEHKGKFYARSESTRLILEGLGGLWRVLGVVLRLVPLPIRDFAYDMLARVRKRIFAKPTDMCPVMPMDLRERFEL